MRGHVVGNLLIVGLWELLGDHVDALDYVGRLLGATGRVLPMALVPMDITAEVRGLVPGDPDALASVRGQVEVATTDGIIDSIALVPPRPAGRARGAQGDRGRRLGGARPRVVVHLGDPAPAGPGAAPGAGQHRRPGGRGAQPGRRGGRDRRASARPTTSRVLAEHAPDLRGPHRARRRAASAPRSSPSSSTSWRRTAPGWSSTTSPRHPARPRHDPAKLAAAYAQDHRRNGLNRRPDRARDRVPRVVDARARIGPWR